MPKQPQKRAKSSSSLPSPPSPFTSAPSSLTPFLSTLRHDHIHITSLDKHPSALKRRIFTVPLLLNIFLSLILIYRANYAIPTYTDLVLAVLGYDSPAKVDTQRLAMRALLRLWMGRVGMLVGDYILVRFVGMWPWGFFLGGVLLSEEEGPVGWRRAIWFQEIEIIVRRSRNWDRECFAETGVKEEWLEQGKEGMIFKERIAPVVRKDFVRSKSGYLMLDKSWDLDFRGMINAHRLVKTADNKFEEFNTAMFVYSERWGWLVWDIMKEHEEGAGDEGTRKLQMVKDKLTLLGKENLFFRWIEVVQSETSQPGAFDKERQAKAIEKIRREFEDRDVDFDEFWADVGGLENMPGMEITG
ncbi:hypothetical protein ACLMJK_003212 [Lecanora helva]